MQEINIKGKPVYLWMKFNVQFPEVSLDKEIAGNVYV